MKKLLSNLPKVDEFLISEKLEEYKDSVPYNILIKSIREGIAFYREEILNNRLADTEMEKEDLKMEITNKIIKLIESKNQLNLRRVINATGTIIHTNLGRSKLMESSVENIVNIASNYNNLEYDIPSGKRGSRYSHIEKLICDITGAESALVVNNNAAAVLLVLDTLTKEREVIVSRGELVEIGGSFRIPAIMEYSGSKLIEVGTTNRTHKKDYLEAITPETKALLKVHTSNYKIMGFTKEVKNEELSKMARDKKLISIEDLGSGVLVDFAKYGYKKEPTVQESLKSGIDVVTFSGDKLLGGPQAGIIVGKRQYIEKMKKNNLLRTLRVSKLTIAALEVTLREYLDESQAVKNIPTLRMILEGKDEVEKRAHILYEKLKTLETLEVDLVETSAMIGGGSMPTELMDSFGVAISYIGSSIVKLERVLRNNSLSIVGRIQGGKLVLDCKTLNENDMDSIYEILSKGIDTI
ncbi:MULTISPECIES: L-seryl-tRNA(Sec) selenium transferase [Psychrilyobacter]|uniref:L-seryl-tRNA(Sec) selenium transferase n=1 Tax=Psychrilyobacter piezotolerans TaxID=2293438 RepID=A0ABX9KIV9_9FUSO|nr:MULTISPECIES: L-seryl-tRNA(Sec) selenium transferase [Psychrilyobacter]MCS5421123.1 L-seryl-tRNA(Sec) selenium transferase [Psychrilyobacter sp. S5]NDI77105.1 L-seryl-tRNA(Sec) selenium transferase [Psychrilyobacter piezotolerans]RDE64105.1 L-seryl-tRNA(Sec) selenium transferase [Psychrilyobacter sp. S5]REI42197.1 L-seryl-tRNA(Sec) selenium transferase [Psychrilyobacter piezotolerans]